MTIWWVDEDLASYDAWILALQLRGIDVRMFSSASQVATAVQYETGGEPSLVIVDLMMSLGEDVHAEMTNLIVDDDRLVGLALAPVPGAPSPVEGLATCRAYWSRLDRPGTTDC